MAGRREWECKWSRQACHWGDNSWNGKEWFRRAITVFLESRYVRALLALLTVDRVAAIRPPAITVLSAYISCTSDSVISVLFSSTFFHLYEGFYWNKLVIFQARNPFDYLFDPNTCVNPYNLLRESLVTNAASERSLYSIGSITDLT